jgi:outer membrane lipopolysaccharide assembly protein LptE/RlpB
VKFKVQSSKFKVQRGKGLNFACTFPAAPLLPFAFCLLPFIFLSSSCGYHLAGAGNLPQGVQRVSFAAFENETLEVGAEKEFQWALEREFRNHGGVTVAEDGEGILSVSLRRLDLRPLSFDRKDQVLEYEIAVTFDVNLTHRESGQMLWQASGLRVSYDYNAVPQVVVTTSPEFLHGTLNSEDLRGLTDIQFSETQHRIALERLFASAAREVYFRLGDNF